MQRKHSLSIELSKFRANEMNASERRGGGRRRDLLKGKPQSVLIQCKSLSLALPPPPSSSSSLLSPLRFGFTIEVELFVVITAS